MGRYQCSHCEYSTNVKSNLTRHNRTHTGAKPFVCSYVNCNRQFRYKMNLTEHIQTQHKKEEHKCNECNKVYGTKRLLTKHMRRHRGDFKCPHCAHAAADQYELKAHIRTRTGDRPYKCPHCSYAAKTNQHLNIHIRTHTGEKPYKCQHCDKGFATWSGRSVHEKTVHK